MLRLSDIVVQCGTFEKLVRDYHVGVYAAPLTPKECRELWRAIETLRLVVEGELGRELHPDTE